MKFVGTKPVEIAETPAIGDIIEVDYTERGILPFTEGGHGRGRYICQARGYSCESNEVYLEVLYDITQNRPFSGDRGIYIGPRERLGRVCYETGSGAVASNSWFTRREVNLLIDEYNKRKKGGTI